MPTRQLSIGRKTRGIISQMLPVLRQLIPLCRLSDKAGFLLLSTSTCRGHFTILGHLSIISATS